MSRIWSHSIRLAAVAALAFVFLPVLRAEQSPAAGGKKVLTLADYPGWKRIVGAAVSADGKWATYTYSPNEGDDTLFVRQLDGDTVRTIPVGGAAGGGRGGGGGAAQFSDDAKWMAYYVNPPGRTGGARGGGRAGSGPPPAGAPAAAQRKLQVMELATGKTFDIPNASGFQFSKEGQYLAVKLNGTAGATHRGTDLLLRRLHDGLTQNIGNVHQYAFDTSGRFLAYSVDAPSKLGNGLYVLRPAGGETRVLDSAAQDYEGLTWHTEGAGIAILRGDKPAGKELKQNVLVVSDDARAGRVATAIDVAADAKFPKDFVLSENVAPRWSKDGSKVFVGIKAQQDAAPAGAGSAGGGDEAPNLDIWHYRDTQLQSVQMIQIAQLRRATFAAVVQPASRSFVRLADETIPAVQPTADDKWAIGRDETPYEYDYSEGEPARADVYQINTATGERTRIARRNLRTLGASPDSQWVAWVDGGHVMARQFASGRTVNVTLATKSFLNTDDDHAGEKPLWGLAGWTKDGKALLLYDKYDLWSLPLDGAKGTNLTAGAGAKDAVQLRLAGALNQEDQDLGWFPEPAIDAPERYQGGGRLGGAGPAAIDVSKPLTLSAYGEWTKKSGYFRMPAGGGAPTPLIWADKNIGGAMKAKSADRVLFTEQTFQEFPDYWVSDASFTSPTQLTDANPQISEYAWGSKTLVDYAVGAGKAARKLQATLTLPAGYQPGKKYPMLVYIYEIMSNTHHQFSMPTYDDRPHMSAYASDGYLVLQPDIVYEIGKPGTSALDCVTAAVKKVIELGYADPAHIGLQGHSWGGYESSFIVTQTNMFAAVVTGAPLTNLTSMYNILYKQSGAWNGGILETSQGRMGANVTPWNAPALYESQSAVFNVAKVQAPFLIMQGTADGAVDWNQGLEYYTAARKAGKNVIFLSYPNEPHHLAIKANQKDFQIRMKQYFDHYLKGTPMPEWMKNGLPQVRKGEAIR